MDEKMKVYLVGDDDEADISFIVRYVLSNKVAAAAQINVLHCILNCTM